MKSAELHLAPAPKRLLVKEGAFNPSGKAFIQILAEHPSEILAAARQTGLAWEVTASPRAKREQVGLRIRVDETIISPDESYKLLVRPEMIEIVASSPAGAYRGACTLKQLIRRTGERIPCLSVYDWPDYPVRGVMLDISRDKVPTMETLYHLVDLLSEWKINHLQLYTEHAFAYAAHPEVWEHASPMTGEEILELDAYCKSRFVELVPNQNSFGHLERWFRHEKYRPMAEAPNGCDTVWGWREAFSLCPGDKRSLPFINGLYEELLPHFSSRLFNVGLDETIDLGRGRSRKVCEERGIPRVYMDFLLEIYKLVEKHNRTMMCWGDIVTKHPELIPELPKDLIALEWGYEYDHPFAENCAKFAAAGVPFFVAPGTSSWNSICGRTDNAIGNLVNAAVNGLKTGAKGFLNTDWGDNGHWQPLCVSYLGFMAGAMASWNAKTNLSQSLPDALSLHAFGDATGKTGRLFFDLGNLYKVFKKRLHNVTPQWYTILSPDYKDAKDFFTLEEYVEMEEQLKQIKAAWRGAKPASPDAAVTAEEVKEIEELLTLSAEIGKAAVSGRPVKGLPEKIQEVKDEHRRVWLLRNREGGLSDSLSNLRI